MSQRLQKYQTAWKGRDDHVVVEGVHAVKHAARFGATFDELVTDDRVSLMEKVTEMTSETDRDFFEKNVVEVSAEEFNDITGGGNRTGVIGLVKKRESTVSDIVEKKPVVFLESPHDAENVGAVIRVAAGYGAGAVVVTGEINPWHASVIRTAAGLHWALPIIHTDNPEEIFDGRTVYACSDEGDSVYEQKLDPSGAYVFGTERAGITDELKSRADQIIALPMQKNVSSLNLATSVSGILYASRINY